VRRQPAHLHRHRRLRHGIVDTGEVCDDGYTNIAAMEECDSSGVDTAMCIGNQCQLSMCGDSYINIAAGEDCESQFGGWRGMREQLPLQRFAAMYGGANAYDGLRGGSQARRCGDHSPGSTIRESLQE
jgi:hypothetical protein